MQDQTLRSYLTALAAREPSPGGGAVAGLHAAQAAALIAMVARYCDGEKYAEHRATVTSTVDRADRLRAACLWLAERDAAAFAAVAAGYAMPRATPADRSARSSVIAAALLAAAQPPASVIGIADELVDLAAGLLPFGNRNVVTDIAAAADALRAAVTTARLNVVVNLGGLADTDETRRLAQVVGFVDQIVAKADQLSAEVLVGLQS